MNIKYRGESLLPHYDDKSNAGAASFLRCVSDEVTNTPAN